MSRSRLELLCFLLVLSTELHVESTFIEGLGGEMACFNDKGTFDFCCDTLEHGPLGNSDCWEDGRSYAYCCLPWIKDTCKWDAALTRIYVSETPDSRSVMEGLSDLPVLEYDVVMATLKEGCCIHYDTYCWDKEIRIFDMSEDYVHCCYPTLFRALRTPAPGWISNEVKRVTKGRKTTSAEVRDAFETKCATDSGPIADPVSPFCRIRSDGSGQFTTSCNVTEVGMRVGGDGVHGFIDSLIRALHILQELAPDFPKVDLFVNTIDMVLYKYDVPVFSFNSYSQNPDVTLLPAEWQLNAVARRYHKKIMSEDVMPWEEKLPIGFWRGSMSAVFQFWNGGQEEPPAVPDTCGLDNNELHYHRPLNASNWHWHPRGRLCLLSTFSPRLDAKFVTLSGFWPSKRTNRNELNAIHDEVKATMERAGMWSGYRPMEDMMKYKYLIVPDITDRLYYMLWMNAVIFIPDSAVKQWGISLLKPWKHYIPIRHDMSDLLTQIEWARSHDAECRQIAARTSALTRHIFSPEMPLLYLYELLKELEVD